MADDLRVDTAALRRQGDRMIMSAGVVRHGHGGALADRRDAYGHRALTDAGGELAARWRRGLEVIADDIDGAGRGLVGVATTFEAADSDGARAARSVAVAQ